VLASPGGTLLEIAWAQGRTSEFLSWAADAGFPCVEVSAGTVPMEDAAKRDLIAAAAERFIVLAEVGSKQAAVRLTAGAVGAGGGRRPGSGCDLDPGRGPGERKRSASTNPPERSARTWPKPWPRRSARTASCSRRPAKTSRPGSSAGSARTVNLANVAPDGALGLETFRLSLRSDTYGTPAPGPVSVHGA